jgi:hypothetical protein
VKGWLPVHDTLAWHGATVQCTSVMVATLMAGVCASAVYLLGGTQETSRVNAFSLVVLVTLTSRSIYDECIDLRVSFEDAKAAAADGPLPRFGDCCSWIFSCQCRSSNADSNDQSSADELYAKPNTRIPKMADERDGEATQSRPGIQVAKYAQLGIIFESLAEGEDPEPEDAGVFQRFYLFLKVFTAAFMEYIGSFWNTIDFASLVLIVITVSRILTNAHRGPTTQLAAFATMLLWLRMINYLSGFERTAPCE